jgi:sialic acid synthase SpsE
MPFAQDAAKVYIVAEAEINHNGDLNTAREMIRSAEAIGADAVKFQYIVADEIAAKDSPYYGFFKKVEFSHQQYGELVACAREAGIDCFFTAPSIATLEKICDFDPPVIKIGSSNLTNLPLLEAAAQTGIPLILSTGMATIGEVECALETVQQVPVCLLHCSVQYPADIREANLKSISTMQAAFPKQTIGYSDHTLGEWAAVAAVALGVKILEKHFTLDRLQEGPDHGFSTDPEGFRRFIEAVRGTESGLGDGVKRPSKSEMVMLQNTRRYLVASEAIPKGRPFSEENLACRRVKFLNGCISPRHIRCLMGWKAPREYMPGEALNWSHFKEGI